MFFSCYADIISRYDNFNLDTYWDYRNICPLTSVFTTAITNLRVKLLFNRPLNLSPRLLHLQGVTHYPVHDAAVSQIIKTVKLTLK